MSSLSVNMVQSNAGPPGRITVATHYPCAGERSGARISWVACAVVEGICVRQYRIIAELGRGALGQLLLGGSPDGRLVALRMLQGPFLSDETTRSWLRSQIAAARHVSGTYTGSIVDADLDTQAPWLASVFIPAPSLEETLAAAGPLPAESVLRLAVGVASALIEIHQAGLVHRDLKPTNVVLTDDGLRVIDFGIAVQSNTPEFVSPEQAAGQPPTTASDIFSLGAVLVTAATGRNPFTAPNPQQALANVAHLEPDLTAVPDTVRWIAGPCLTKDPARRPTPAQVLEAIGQHNPATAAWAPAVRELIAKRRGEVDRLVGGNDATVRTAVPPPPVPVPPRKPAAPAEPEGKKRRPGVIIGVSVGVAFIVGVTAFAAGLLASQGNQPANAAAPSSHVAPAATTTAQPTATTTTTSATATTTTPTTIALQPNVWYNISNASTGKCMDVSGGGTSDGTPVLQWTCGSGKSNQNWEFLPTSGGYYRIVSQNAPALGLDVTGGPAAVGNGTPIQIWTYGGGTNQQWKPLDLGNGQYAFVAQHSGSCLNVPNQSAADGTVLQQQSCDGSGGEAFALTPAS